jgi:hypothetical protein
LWWEVELARCSGEVWFVLVSLPKTIDCGLTSGLDRCVGFCLLDRQHGLVVVVVVVVIVVGYGWWSRNSIVELVTIVELAGTP